jgi:hypothetical protein
MEAQDFFYTVATVALVLISAFIVFVFFAAYRITKMARAGFRALSFTAEEMRQSLGTIAKGWGRASLMGVIIKLLRFYFFKR